MSADLSTPKSDHDKLVDAAENVVIAFGMAWDLEGTIDALQQALRPFTKIFDPIEEVT